MKCSDIPNIDILWFILCVNRVGRGIPCTFTNRGPFNIARGMPPGTPEKLRLKKMSSLMRKGLITGCPCGCTGNFFITEKGKEYLKKHFEPTNRLPNL